MLGVAPATGVLPGMPLGPLEVWIVARRRLRRVVSSVRASRESGDKVGGRAMGSCWMEALGVGIVNLRCAVGEGGLEMWPEGSMSSIEIQTMFCLVQASSSLITPPRPKDAGGGGEEWRDCG